MTTLMFYAGHDLLTLTFDLDPGKTIHILGSLRVINSTDLVVIGELLLVVFSSFMSVNNLLKLHRFIEGKRSRDL